MVTPARAGNGHPRRLDTSRTSHGRYSALDPIAALPPDRAEAVLLRVVAGPDGPTVPGGSFA